MNIRTLLTAAGFLAAAGAQADVLTNGDFESSSNAYTASQAMPGWSWTGDVFLIAPWEWANSGLGFFYRAGSIAQDGGFAVDFNGGQTSPNGVLSQTFSTYAGLSYTVSYQFGATGGGDQTLHADILGANGSSLLATQSARSVFITYPFQPLTSFSFTFVADGSHATIKFRDDASNYTTNQDGILDNVVVSGPPASVPAPATPALLALGLAGLGLARRKQSARR